jgi:hypothetical protein
LRFIGIPWAIYGAGLVKTTQRGRVQWSQTRDTGVGESACNEKVAKIPLNHRSNIRTFAEKLGIPSATLHRIIKRGDLRVHTRTLKTPLTVVNKLARVIYAYNLIDMETMHFQNLFNLGHMDEKWFYLIKLNQRYYLLPEERDPHHTVQSKRHVTKVMFTCVVFRPRKIASQNNRLFDGKIGIWPYVVQVPAKRNSKNRKKGTLETKSYEVTKKVYLDMLIDNVLPALEEKWPRGPDMIQPALQHDNARPHNIGKDPRWIKAVESLKLRTGIDVTLVFQPANSYDFNVNDLAFFSSIQSLQYRLTPKTIDELIKAVLDSFELSSATTLNHTFLSLMQCMLETMKIDGENSYKLVHMAKKKLEQAGKLPLTIPVDHATIQHVKEFIQLSALDE